MEPTTHKTKLNLEHKPQESKDWNEVFHLISDWDIEKIAATKVMVVGAGALGNEVLKNLALLNIGHIFIVDFDEIEYSNLSRSVLFRNHFVGQPKAAVAAARVKELNPNVKVQYVNGDILCDVGLGIFKRMDVIIGCLDNRVARLYINRHTFKVGKTWVDGGIMNLDGQLAVYNQESACYECQLGNLDQDMIRKRLSCADMATRNSNYGRIPTTPLSASIIGAMQVQEAIKIVFGQKKSSLAGQKFNYYGMANEYLVYPMTTERLTCESHEVIQSIIPSDLSSDHSVERTLEWLEHHFESDNIQIILHYDIVLEAVTKKTEKEYQLIVPKPHFSDAMVRKYEEIPYEGIVFSKRISSIDRSFPDLNYTLKELAIPPLHILKVKVDDSKVHYVELSADISFLNFK